MRSDAPLEFTGTTVLVTGASGEIGAHLVSAFAERGASVVAIDVSSRVHEVAEAAGAIGIRADLSDVAALEGALESIDLASVGVVVNNAGINRHNDPLDTSYDDWDAVFDVNVRGAFELTRLVARRRIAAKRPLSVVSVSSTAATTALGRGNLVYGMSKAALNQMTRELAVEWGPFGVRVNAVQPAQIATAAWNAVRDDPAGGARYERVLAGIPLGRLIAPAEVVGPVLFLASDAASAVSGVILPVDGGNLALNASGSLPSEKAPSR
ncbi:UNVERIFIED_CONTAM: SDR family oxidoreductase [Microbacterium sp. SLM126]